MCDLRVLFVSVLYRLAEEPGQRGSAGEYCALCPPHGPFPFVAKASSPSSLALVTLSKPEPSQRVEIQVKVFL